MTVESLFCEALALSPDQRAAFLDRACGGDDDLRHQVEDLLRAHDRGGHFLDRPAVTLDHNGPEVAAGAVIAGRYVLQEKIGEGGMGEVWVAKQTEPVKRKVALKLIKTGMDSKAVLARFEQERQALALMEHPHIARVLDGGMTPTGQPFFVMELVNGLPLTKYCDEARLTPKERLELFVPICQAVQHAHQKGIVHRDLKPANILVTMIDGRPVPKVIDFGVAKATAGKLTDESMSTQFGAVIGTLEYMAPEQAGFAGEDIDTRADIYSLGVILYELLTGLKPHDAKRLREAALTEMVRIIREEEPSRPSARLSTEASLPSLAALRQTEPKRLTALLRGELDWVVMKCLEKQRDRRYETANALARDLQRYLSDEPVEARPASAGYRLKKFVRRNRPQVIAASLVLFALLGGIAGTTFGLIRAEHQRQLADDRRIEADKQKTRAETETKIAQAVRDFLQKKLLGQADMTAQANALLEGGGLASAAKHNPTILELLDRAAAELTEEKIEKNFPNQPLLQAEILMTVGNTYRAIGHFERALGFLKRALALRTAALSPEHTDTLTSMNDLGRTYLYARKLDLAEPILEKTVALRTATLGPEHADTLDSKDILAEAYRFAYKLDKALPMLEETLKLSRAKFGRHHPDTLERMNLRAAGYWLSGKTDLALTLLEEVYDVRKARLGLKHPNTLRSLHNLAIVHRTSGKPALPLAEEAFKLAKETLGPDHPLTIGCMNTLADVYSRTGKMELALSLGKDAVQIAKAKFGPKHPGTLFARNTLAIIHLEAGEPHLALPLLEQTLVDWKAIAGPDHPGTLMVMNTLGQANSLAGNVELALSILKETLKLRKEHLGPDHPDTIKTMWYLAETYGKADKLDRAVLILEEAVTLAKGKLGPDHPVLKVTKMLGVHFWKLKRLDRSIPLFEEALKIDMKKFGPQHSETLITMANLGVNYADAGRFKDALPLLEAAYQAAKKHPEFNFVTPKLLDAYVQVGETEKAVALLKQQIADARTQLPENSPQLAGKLASLGLSLINAKAYAEAEPLVRECLAMRDKNIPDSWLTFNTMSLLGGSLLGQKKYADAEPLLLAGYKGMKQREKTIPPQGTLRLVQAVEWLGQLYDATGKKDDAAKWRKELEAIRAAEKPPGP